MYQKSPWMYDNLPLWPKEWIENYSWWQPLLGLPQQLQLIRLKLNIITCKCQVQPFTGVCQSLLYSIIFETFAEFQLWTKYVSHDHEFTNLIIKIIFWHFRFCNLKISISCQLLTQINFWFTDNVSKSKGPLNCSCVSYSLTDVSQIFCQSIFKNKSFTNDKLTAKALKITYLKFVCIWYIN